MMRSWLGIVGLALALAIGWAVPSAQADEKADKAQAREIFRNANDEFHAGNHKKALSLYRKAYALFPSEKILLNEATCLADMGRPAEAALRYLQYVQESNDADKRAEVRVELHELGKVLGRLKVPKQDGGTSIYVDGKKHPDSPPTILWLKPGKHQVVLKRKKKKRAFAVSLRAGVVSELPGKGSAAKDDDEEEEEEDGDDDEEEEDDEEADASVTEIGEGGGPSTLRIASWVTGGVGLVALAVGVKYGLDVRRIEGQLDGLETTWTPELQARHDEGKSAETRMYLFSGIGAAAVIAGAVLYFISDSDGPKATVSASSDSFTVGLAGSF